VFFSFLFLFLLLFIDSNDFRFSLHKGAFSLTALTALMSSISTSTSTRIDGWGVGKRGRGCAFTITCSSIDRVSLTHFYLSKLAWNYIIFVTKRIIDGAHLLFRNYGTAAEEFNHLYYHWSGYFSHLGAFSCPLNVSLKLEDFSDAWIPLWLLNSLLVSKYPSVGFNIYAPLALSFGKQFSKPHIQFQVILLKKVLRRGNNDFKTLYLALYMVHYKSFDFSSVFKSRF